MSQAIRNAVMNGAPSSAVETEKTIYRRYPYRQGIRAHSMQNILSQNEHVSWPTPLYDGFTPSDRLRPLTFLALLECIRSPEITPQRIVLLDLVDADLTERNINITLRDRVHGRYARSNFRK